MYCASALTRSSSATAGGNFGSPPSRSTAAASSVSSRTRKRRSSPRSASGISSGSESIVARRYGFLLSSPVTRNFSIPLSTMLKRPSGSGSECVTTPAQPIGKIAGRPS
jgi:hypothetical protein